MNNEMYELQDIEDVFVLYSDLVKTSSSCNNTQPILSELAYVIDVYGMCTILNFFNQNADRMKAQQGHLLIIRFYALVVFELIKYLMEQKRFDISEYNEPNSYEDITSLRNKIHQYRYREFDKNVNEIDNVMGRSRKCTDPHLDLCLLYKKIKADKVLSGTNIFQYRFSEAKDQVTVNCMQRIIRTVERTVPYPEANFEIQSNSENIKYVWETYSYIDIVRASKIKDEKVIDRVLFAFDDLCMIDTFFRSMILVERYLIEAPYLVYFFSKMISVILDETFDNFCSYIKRIDNSDALLLNFVFEGVSVSFKKKCKIMRNNLHYSRQEEIDLGEVDDLYEFMIYQLDIVSDMMNKIREIININPTKRKIRFYRFLRWIQF